jgi:hypothetical protein
MMKHTRFCLISLLFVMLAVGVHLGALRNWSQSMRIRARAVTATQEQRAQMRAEAHRFSQRVSIFHVAGVCLAIAAAAFLTISFRRRESAAWRSVPVALLVFYVMFQFVLV